MTAAIVKPPMRVLVVEDEMMVAMLIEDMLTDMGHVVVGLAMRQKVALQLAREEAFDIAVLDVNLGDGKSFPVAALLRERGLPFVFATGYGENGIEREYAGSIVLRKPFEESQLRDALERATRQGKTV